MHTALCLFMALMGLGIALVWTRDIVDGSQLDLSRGRLRAREPESGSLLLPHWIAEYSTAAALLTASVGLWLQRSWAEPLSLLALGALTYTSVNSLGWALARPERGAYAVPMALGAVGGLTCIGIVLGGGL